VVTELKFDSTNVDYVGEMRALATEDLAQRMASVEQDVDRRGEAAQRLAAPDSSALARAQEQGPAILVTEDGAAVDMHEVLARQMGMEYVDLNNYPDTDFKVLRMLNAEQVKQYKVFPLRLDSAQNVLTLAICDPSDPTVVDDLSLMLGCAVHAVVAREDDIIDRINRSYGLGDESLGSMLVEFETESEEDLLTPDAGNVINLTDLSAIERQAPLVKLTNLILLKAINEHASDIHIEPFENLVRVRYRVDGVLREMDSPPKDMQIGLMSRLKVMANLDIAETRRPQDGRINLRLPEDREVELRVTTAPTVHGEGIAMRVLDKSLMRMSINQLGMNQDVLEEFLKEVRKPNGIVLVTGPTGCGKTTTLYSAINEVKSVEEKLITTEDPVEYQVDGIIQINIHESVGLTYARCLRSILRQDPDRILVGEIRDLETASIAVNAALTGHLVFSTLHTNSAAGTITRLMDMGVEPFLISSTIEAIVGQRLVRTVCPNCRAEHDPAPEELAEFGVQRHEVEDITFAHGTGCEECAFTGYKGRIGVFEQLKVTDAICDLILQQATTDEMHAKAIEQGMTSLRQDGWIKICMGVTTFSEVASRTPADEGVPSARIARL